MRVKFGEERKAFSIPADRGAFANSVKSAVGGFFERKVPAINRDQARAMANEFMKSHQDRNIFRRAWHSLIGRPAGDAMMDGMFRALVRERAEQARAGKIRVETSFNNHGSSAVAYVPLDRAMAFVSIYEKNADKPDPSSLSSFAEEIAAHIAKAKMSGADPSAYEIPVKFSTQWRRADGDSEAIQTVFRVGVGNAPTVAVAGTERIPGEGKGIRKEISRARSGDARDFEAAALLSGSERLGSKALASVAEAGRKAKSANRVKNFVMKGAAGAGMIKSAALLAALGAAASQAAAYSGMFGGAPLAGAVMSAGAAAAMSGMGFVAAGMAGAAVMAKFLSKSRLAQAIGNMLSREDRDNPVNMVLESLQKPAESVKGRKAPGMA